MPPRVLIAGAGAVGQVYGLAAQRAGAEVHFLVRPHHQTTAELLMHELKRPPAVLKPSGWQKSPAEARAQPWDQLWITTPTDTFAQPWLQELVEATGDATIVGLLPELSKHVPAARRVDAAVPFIAWQSPLPHESGPEGIVFYWPPLAKVPVSGPDARVEPVLQLLRAGGLKAQQVKNVAALGTRITVTLIPIIAALETAGWRVNDFKGGFPSLAAAASREASGLLGVRGPVRWLARGWLFRFVLAVATRLAPFNAEAYLRYHFTKVGAQTRKLFSDWQAEGARQGRSTPAVDALAKALGPAP